MQLYHRELFEQKLDLIILLRPVNPCVDIGHRDASISEAGCVGGACPGQV